MVFVLVMALAASLAGIPAQAGPAAGQRAPILTEVFARDGAADIFFIPVYPLYRGGGVPGTPLTVVVHPGEQTQVVSGENVQSVRFTGLTNGTSYRFTAYQSDTAHSAPSDPVVPAPGTVPVAPTIVSAFGRPSAAVVSWDAPQDGGSAITGYQVRAEPGSHVVDLDSGARTATVSGLDNGTKYELTVTAKNNNGTGPAAKQPVTATAPYPPGPPRQVTVQPVVGAQTPALDVSWEAPEDDGGALITGYTVTGGSAAVTGTGTTARLIGLDANTPYTISVTATTEVATGPAGTAARAVRPAVRIGESTFVLSADSLKTMTHFGRGDLGFTNPTEQVLNLPVGSIVAAGPSQEAPAGFLRTVERIDTTGNLLHWVTKDAKLDQAVPQGEVSIADSLDAGEVTGFLPLRPGVRMAPTVGGGLGFDMNFRPDNDDTGTEAGLRGEIRGDITVDPHWDFYFSLGFFQYSTFKFTATADVKISMEAKLTAFFKSTLASKDLAEVKFACQTFFVGPVPVVICPVLTFAVQLNAEGSLGLTVTGTYEQTIGGRAVYESGYWNSENLTGEPVRSFGAEFAAHATVTLEFPANMSFYLYGLAGPGLTLSPFLTLGAHPLENPWATIDLGIRADITFRIPLLSIDYAVTLGALSYRVWDTGAPYSNLVVEPATTSLRNGASTRFSADSQDCAVVWSLGPGARGKITADGTYTAPAEGETNETVTATQPKTASCPALTATAAVHVGKAKPSVPQNVKVVVEYPNVRVSWTPPADDGGAAVAEYAVVQRNQYVLLQPLVAGSSTETTFVFSGAVQTFAELQTSLQLVARNEVGWGPLSTLVAPHST